MPFSFFCKYFRKFQRIKNSAYYKCLQINKPPRKEEKQMTRENSRLINLTNLIISFVVIGMVALSGSMTAKAAANRKSVLEENKPSYLCVAVAQTPEEADAETISAVTGVNNILNQFPQEMLQGMVEDGWKVLVTNKVHESRWGAFAKTIEIPRGDYQLVTYKMLANYLDARNGYLCFRYEFYRNVYIRESQTFYHYYETLFDDADTYMADTLYWYCKDGENLKKLCPKTYQYIDEQMQNNQSALEKLLDIQ